MDRAHLCRKELLAEMYRTFLCAEFDIYPSDRHADYIGCWLDILREDVRAIFRAASEANNAADYLLAYVGEQAADEGRMQHDGRAPWADAGPFLPASRGP